MRWTSWLTKPHRLDNTLNYLANQTSHGQIIRWSTWLNKSHSPNNTRNYLTVQIISWTIGLIKPLSHIKGWTTYSWPTQNHTEKIICWTNRPTKPHRSDNSLNYLANQTLQVRSLICICICMDQQTINYTLPMANGYTLPSAYILLPDPCFQQSHLWATFINKMI